MVKSLKNKRSSTGNHPLLPASHPGSTFDLTPQAPARSLLTWTLGRGSVIWRIWPAVLLHTVFAAAVVTISMKKIIDLEIPSVMLTVLGVVIGFVISYRAISGYDRYWMGRTCWSDVIRNSRTLGRLIWFHVPLRLTAKTAEEIQSGKTLRPEEELNKIMTEKRMALDLLEGFSIALKHHIRGELGIYYEDLYHLVRPMHDHDHTADQHAEHAISTALPSPRRAQRITTQTIITEAPESSSPSPTPSHLQSPLSSPLVDVDVDPIVPPINAYGTFNAFDPTKLSSGPPGSSSGPPPPRGHPLLKHRASLNSQLSLASVSSFATSQHRPLLPSAQPPRTDNMMDKVAGDLIPFAGTIAMLREQFAAPALEVLPPGVREIEEAQQRKWQGPIASQAGLHSKHRPKVAGGGENLPLEILRCLSEWCSVLEDRGTVPGTSMGTMIGTIAAFEDSLSALERILTTPLPFVYAVHISTVWVYLFFLPFQLVSQFGYYTIPGVAIAAFIYLGFLAAGEEIEQPFGGSSLNAQSYNTFPFAHSLLNDLDLDLFCHSIIHADIKQLKSSPCLNAYFGPEAEEEAATRLVPRRSRTLTELTEDELQMRANEGVAEGLNHDWN
ncbi:hypothetical protein GALMADRAFT_252832 [Galerina marginata CBS 339.88]|uniref:Uncharacterized protein n=1 Tax=Galerina marginata (strain CBS 339.88) TaxID=685588 RepID=A0A067SNY3_GALM3|nr:hypothetical protein GALMADRAFT_252832 [Galerina marginata CBS 339.88]